MKNFEGRFVFFGTPWFSARLLEKLLEHGFVPEAVVCNPDRLIGRKKILTAPPVKTATQAWSQKTGHPIKILQPEKLDSEFEKRLNSFNSDFFLVFAYNKIFRKNILAIPRHGAIGVHPSFLPKYRGPSPFQSAILNGEEKTGVTLYLLDEGIDSGPIVARSEPVAIKEDDDFHSLAEKLADTSADLIVKIIPKFVSEEITSKIQDESAATYTKKFTTQDGFIEPKNLADAEDGRDGLEHTKKILRKINALNPEPGAWTMSNGKRVKLLSAKIEGARLILRETQIEGEKPKKI